MRALIATIATSVQIHRLPSIASAFVVWAIASPGALFGSVALPALTGCAASNTEDAADTYEVPDFEFVFDFNAAIDTSFTPPGDTGNPGGPDDTGPGGGDGQNADGQGGDGQGGADADTVEADACTPMCDGRTCGPDGCGGFCGVCPAGVLCREDGQCPPAGDTCENPLVLGFGGTTKSVSGSFARATDDVVCAGAAASADAIVLLVPSATGRALITVKGGGTTFSAADTCGATPTCVAGPGMTALTLDLTAGVPVPLIVEAGQTVAPSFTVTVASCSGLCLAGTCAVNACGDVCPCAGMTVCDAEKCVPKGASDTCGTAGPISTLPFTATIDFGNHDDDVACVSGAAGRDQVFAYLPTKDTRVRATVVSESAVAAYLTTHCLGGASACGTAATSASPVGAALGLGQTTYLVLEGPAEATATVTLEACTGCDPACPCFDGETCQNGACVAPADGDGCDDAFVLPLGHSVRSLGLATDDQACLDGTGTADIVLSFTAPYAGAFGFDFNALHTLWVYELGECGNPSSCVERAATPVTFRRTLDAGETVTWVVEVQSSGLNAGVSIDVTDCASACVGAACDVRACGQLCGCSGGDSCVSGVCDEPPAGDSCDAPEPLPTLPFTVEGTLEGRSDELSCGLIGAQTPDAVYAFVAPATAVYVATVVGPGEPVVFHPPSCVNGSNRCDGGASDTIFFFARKGETVTLVVDALASPAPFSLSATRVEGLAGALGAACSSSADCPLAERCLFGVCTQGCSAAADCTGATAGPRGATFRCQTSVCFDGPDGCEFDCLPTTTSGTCATDATCASCEVCAGYGVVPGASLTTVCLTSGTLAAVGAPCTDDRQCAADLCVAGTCVRPCTDDTGCGDALKCLGTVVGSTPGGARAIRGLCRTWPGTGASCEVDADCPGGVCDATLAPTGGVARRCLDATTTTDPFAFGDLCTADSQCSTSRCEFEDVLGPVNSYCTHACTDAADCPSGYPCAAYTVWDGDTVSNPLDDAVIRLCLRDAEGAGCRPAGVNTCAAGLSCVPLESRPEFGRCTAALP